MVQQAIGSKALGATLTGLAGSTGASRTSKLGGSIVGRHAAELIVVIALAVTAGLKVGDIVDSLLVHPTLSEALADVAD